MNQIIEHLSANNIFTDEELLKAFESTLYEYHKSLKISEIITEIIHDLGYSKQLPKDKKLETRFKILSHLAEKRNIPKSNKLTPVVVNTSDIIKELNNMLLRDITWIENHSYLYDTRHNGIDESKKGSIKQVREIKDFYKKVITSVEPVKVDNTKTR